MSFIIFIDYCYNDPIKDDEMVGTRVTAVRREIRKAFWKGNPKEESHLKDLHVDARTVLELMLKY